MLSAHIRIDDTGRSNNSTYDVNKLSKSVASLADLTEIQVRSTRSVYMATNPDKGIGFSNGILLPTEFTHDGFILQQLNDKCKLRNGRYCDMWISIHITGICTYGKFKELYKILNHYKLVEDGFATAGLLVDKAFVSCIYGDWQVNGKHVQPGKKLLSVITTANKQANKVGSANRKDNKKCR